MPYSFFASLFILAFGFLIFIVRIIASWKIFEKAGEPGWLCLIPFLGTYTQYKFTWDTRYFPIYVIAILAELILSRIGQPSLFIAFLFLIVTVINLVIHTISLHKLSKAFGHGVGFTIGLFVSGPIFTLILGFGSSQYQGPQ